MKSEYQLEVCRNKHYYKVYTGRMSQCYKRTPSLYGRYRIKRVK